MNENILQGYLVFDDVQSFTLEDWEKLLDQLGSPKYVLTLGAYPPYFVQIPRGDEENEDGD